MDSSHFAQIALWAVPSCALAISAAWIGVEQKRSRGALLGTVFGAAQIPALVFALAYARYGRVMGPDVLPALVVTGLICATVTGFAAVLLHGRALQYALCAIGAPLLLAFLYSGGFFLLPLFALAVTFIAIAWSIATALRRKRPRRVPPELPGKSSSGNGGS